MEHRYCRECGTDFPQEDLREYDVVLKDGDYPSTTLCLTCADEYRADGKLKEKGR